MPTCNADKFVITKNFDNTFNFTIKADGSTLPMVIDVTDTFEASLIKQLDESVALTKALVVEDLLNGKVSLTITALETASLVSERGSKADRYYAKPTYKLVLTCNTLNNGDFLVKVPEVYVD